MTDNREMKPKRASGSDKSVEPRGGGDHVNKAKEWGGGSKGAVTDADRANENSSART